MKIPVIQGVIDRRILVNFTADPNVVQKILPPPFTPKVHSGRSIVGICLIRLKQIRPKGFPSFAGISSENAAHRIAVEWKENGATKEGVFIPRRDTSSRLNNLAGGRIFPGKHHLAKFDVKEEKGNYRVAFQSSDGTSISVDASLSKEFNSKSIFNNIEAASQFFEKGLIGYSPGKDKDDGLLLQTFNWSVQPLEVSKVHSSFFENENMFPTGSIQFDNALLMTHIHHEWRSPGIMKDCGCLAE